MKKIIILLTLILISSTTIAINDAKTIKSVRINLGETLNQTTKELKVNLNKINQLLKEDKKDIDIMRVQAKEFVDNSEKSEINPTLLNHAVQNLTPCDYTKEELIWDGNNWECVDSSYEVDCIPNKYEHKAKSTEFTGTICTTDRSKYKYVDSGWGVCNPATGLQKTQYLCMLHDDDDKPLYEVSDSNCLDPKPKPEEYNCWGVWEASDWNRGDDAYSKYLKGERKYLCSALYQSLKNFCVYRYPGPGCVEGHPTVRQYQRLCGSLDYHCLSNNMGASYCKKYPKYDFRKVISTRTVKCSKRYCNPSTKPTDIEEKINNFKSWSTGGWSSWRSSGGSCGRKCQHKYRSVSCPSGFCDPNRRPSPRKTYNCITIPCSRRES